MTTPAMAPGTGIRLPRFGAAALAVLAAVALSGCTTAAPTTPSSATQTTAAPQQGQISVGDCLTSAAAPDASPIVDCAQPHDAEVYKRHLLRAGDFPGDDAISETATTFCEGAFATFAGITFADSAALGYSWYYPTQASWADGDREILCLIYEVNASGAATMSTGTLEGADE